ncbi:MAG: carbohydrate ABC transporter permease [Streptosporangiales bacterium]|nr:carbohydrate ABC transporter permease [Streptosporangiales bacterium]
MIRLARPRLLSNIAVGVLIVLLFLLPVLYVLMMAFETPAHFLNSPMTPGTPTVSNFGQAWSSANLGGELVNTVIFSVVSGALSVAFGLLIAFPVARRLLRGHSMIYTYLFIGMFLPMSIIPMYAEARMLGLWDNAVGYILIHIAMPGLPGMALAVVLLTASISSVPLELDEAAWMEGSSYLAYLWRVIVPISRPALLIGFLYAMLNDWNDIIGPVVLLNNPALATVTKGINSFAGDNSSQYTLIAAAVVIASLPVVILFIACQRQINEASLAGSLKG